MRLAPFVKVAKSLSSSSFMLKSPAMSSARPSERLEQLADLRASGFGVFIVAHVKVVDVNLDTWGKFVAGE